MASLVAPAVKNPPANVGDIRDVGLTQGSKPGSPALASEFLTTEPSGKQNILSYFREK